GRNGEHPGTRNRGRIARETVIRFPGGAFRRFAAGQMARGLAERRRCDVEEARATGIASELPFRAVEKPRRCKTKSRQRLALTASPNSGGHGTRTRNPLRGTSFPMRPLAIRLPSGVAAVFVHRSQLAARAKDRSRGGMLVLCRAGASARSLSLAAVRNRRQNAPGRTAFPNRGSWLVEYRSAADELDELVVRFEAAELLGELLHRVHVMHRRERPAQHGDRVQRVRVV